MSLRAVRFSLFTIIIIFFIILIYEKSYDYFTNSVGHDQTRVLWRLIRVYAVCLCPFY